MTTTNATPRMVGDDPVMYPLANVSKNSWNPNAMDDFEKASLREGLAVDGWLKSQSLLVWRTDETGEEKMIIIDGEHRWIEAMALGFVDGPMVFLDGYTESQAKALTVKIDAKRGKFRQEPLAKLLQEIQFDIGATDLSLGMGIRQDELMKMLAFTPTVIEPMVSSEAHAPTVPAPTSATPMHMQGHVKLVQLFYGDADHAEFTKAIEELAAKHGTKNVSETILAAVRAARE